MEWESSGHSIQTLIKFASFIFYSRIILFFREDNHRIKILQKKITHQLSIACEITKLKGLLRI